MTKYKEILRLHSQGISNRSIAASLECSRNTVRKALERAGEENISWPLPESLTDRMLEQRLFGRRGSVHQRKMPDWEYIHQEMAHAGVTLSLLWNEYCEHCRIEGSQPLMYTQFCYHYQQFAAKNKATLHLEHKPGDRMEVDWAGDTARLQDTITGKPIPVYLFVAVLSSSGYAYAEGFLSRDMASWIAAHVNAYQFFGGATRMVTPDCAIIGIKRHEEILIAYSKRFNDGTAFYYEEVLNSKKNKALRSKTLYKKMGTVSDGTFLKRDCSGNPGANRMSGL
jgi:transposase